MPSECVVGCWTEGLRKILKIWFGPDLQADKNQDDEANEVVSLNKKWSEEKLSLKGRVEVMNAFIATVIIYFLTVVPCLG